jgi:hypothetical protein
MLVTRERDLMPLRPWIAAVVMLFAATAQAVETKIVFAPRRALQAGETVTVGWSGLPADADEHEFLLFIDTGEKFRLTHQLMPVDGTFEWTVPSLPSKQAVLQLRAGFDGEEIVLATSEPFVIRGGPHRTSFEFRDGEWWAIEEGRPSPDPPAVLPVQRVMSMPAVVPPRDWLLHTEIRLGDLSRADRNAVPLARVDTRSGAPLTVPQRK